jgi:hypothetical protein
MNMTSLLAFLTPFLPAIENTLVGLENNDVQPELQSLIAGVQNPVLKSILTDLDVAIDAFIKAEIAKI